MEDLDRERETPPGGLHMRSITSLPRLFRTAIATIPLLLVACGSDATKPPEPDASAEVDSAAAAADSASANLDGPAATGDTAVSSDGTVADASAGDVSGSDAITTGDTGASDGPGGADVVSSGDGGACGTVGQATCRGSICGDGLCVGDNDKCLMAGMACGQMAGMCNANGTC